MNDVGYPIVELRQYTLHPGQREVLIGLFDREFIETQEAVGLAVLGQFRDLDDPDRFVWLRGFKDMPSRAEALGRFYGGPAWEVHKDQANATMIDSDDVLLLRPATAQSGFPTTTVARPQAGDTTSRSLLLATLYYQDHPFDDTFLDFFHRQIHPVLVNTGASPLAYLQTEPSDNTFPALPVRTGENVFVWFTLFPSLTHLSDHARRLERSDRWQSDVLPTLSKTLTGAPQQLRLTPTSRSLLR